jgi:hypothetical protein
MQRLKPLVIAALLAFGAATPAAAQESLERGSAASLGASLALSESAAWIAYAGSEFTVRAVSASANGVALSLLGVADGIEASAVIAKEAAEAASLAVGTSVTVLAESTGYALVASGTLLAFVPNEVGRALLHHARYPGRLR